MSTTGTGESHRHIHSLTQAILMLNAKAPSPLTRAVLFKSEDSWRLSRRKYKKDNGTARCDWESSSCCCFGGYFIYKVKWWCLASGSLASSQVYSCHAFTASFMRLLSCRYFSINLVDENLVFVRLLLVLSAVVVVVGQFSSFPLSVVCQLQQRKAAWTLNITEEEILSVFLEQITCWSVIKWEVN